MLRVTRGRGVLLMGRNIFQDYFSNDGYIQKQELSYMGKGWGCSIILLELMVENTGKHIYQFFYLKLAYYVLILKFSPFVYS